MVFLNYVLIIADIRINLYIKTCLIIRFYKVKSIYHFKNHLILKLLWEYGIHKGKESWRFPGEIRRIPDCVNCVDSLLVAGRGLAWASLSLSAEVIGTWSVGMHFFLLQIL